MPRPETIQEAKLMLRKEIEEAKKRYQKRLIYIEFMADKRKNNSSQILVEKALAASPEIAKKRYRQVDELKYAGFKLTEIANMMGVSRTRIGQMLNSKKAEEELSVRACNVLARILPAEFTPQLASQLTEQRLLDAHNCGKVTLTEIKLWLKRHNLKLSPTSPSSDT